MTGAKTTTEIPAFKAGDWVALDEIPAMRNRNGTTTTNGNTTQIDEREAQLLNAVVRDVLPNVENAQAAVQDCPECDGAGIIGPASFSVTAVDDHQTCPMCKGSGIDESEGGE